MNKKAFLPLVILLCGGIFFSCQLIANKNAGVDDGSDLNIDPIEAESNSTATKNELILMTINRMISEGHFSPKNLNDEFSKDLFKNYIESVDFNKIYFTQQDIAEFSKFETQLDDQVKLNDLSFQKLVSSTLSKRIKLTEVYYTEALEKPFTFTGNEILNLDGKKVAWCADETELKQRWYLSMKYRTLAKYEELLETQKTKIEKKDTSLKKVKTNIELEVEARTSIKKNLDKSYKKLLKQTDNERFVNFINVYAHTVDPHTDFFPPLEKQSFDDQMSGSFYGIGAVLKTNEEGNCTIQEVRPGSPSAKEGRLKVGDIIEKVAQANEEPVEINGWEIGEVVKIIRGKKGTSVKLTTKHLSGVVEVITIVREKIVLEETFARSAIINQGGNKIGYVYLPEFYADFGNVNGARCAKDMATEIEKLKKDNVKGIIVDLRNNGGGSLQDVVEIGGQFIDKGPMVQVKSKGAPAQALSDEDNGLLYDGPLVVMINNLSASASEILAAAIQDYKRGIVVGANSFGKGTVQRNIELDRFLVGHDSIKPIGALKLTLQKFYRINGGATQLKGVAPDVVIADSYEPYEISERKETNPMPWDEIAKAEYQYYNAGVDFTKLVANSNARVQNNSSFNTIKESNAFSRKRKDDNEVSLNEVKYIADLKEIKALNKKIEAAGKDKKIIDVFNNTNDKSVFAKADSVKQKSNDIFIKALQKDHYVAESSLIILDWIKMASAKGNKVTKK
jgi:carboxyl-terminal processing protease